MSDFSVGDMAQLFLLKRQNAQVRQDISDLSSEVTTGLATDQAKHLSGDFAPLVSLRNSLARLDGFASVNAEAGLMAEAMQTTLGTIDAQASSVTTRLITAGTGGATTSLTAVGFDTEQAFRTAMQALNTRFGDRSLFAGQGTDGAALGSADTVLADLTTLTTGVLTVQGVTDALDAYFADGGTFDTTIYQGGAALAPVAVAPDESATLDTRATDPAIKATLKSLAMGALLNHGVLSNSLVAQSDLALKAGTALMAGQTGRAQLSAHLGTVQARIGDADTRNRAQISALNIAQSQLMSVDPYESATKLQAAQSQLEALYTITARLSHLNLTDYLS